MGARHPESERIHLSLRRAMLIAAAASFVVSAAGIPVRATYGAQTTADEPHYLLTAISLAEDRNLDVSDEISRKLYLPFHELGLNPQAEPFPDGKLLSPHDPLLPALLAPAFAVGGGWIAAKLLLCLAAAGVAALSVWLAVRRLGARPSAACAAASIFGMSVPLGVYGNQVYPEILAALVTLAGVGALTDERLSRRAVWIVAASIVLLPWSSIKYVPVALAIFGVIAARLWSLGRKEALMALTTGLALAGVMFAVTHLWWYGGLTPYAAGDHFVETGEFSVVGTNWNPLGRARRFVGLLIDDKFGLAAWQPAWLLAVPALASFAVSRNVGTPYLRTAFLVPLAAAWLNATFIALTMQGFWFPGRQVVVVLPLVAVLIAGWASRAAARLKALYLAGALGLLSLGWLLMEGWQKRITWVVDFYDTRNGFYRLWQSVFPDYLDVSPMTWILQTAWVAVLGWWGFATYRKEKSPGMRTPGP